MESKDPGKERASPATPVGGSRRPSSGSGSGGKKRGHHRRARKHWRSSNEDRQQQPNNRGRSRRGSGGGGGGGGPGRHQNLLNRISSSTSGSAASHSSSAAPIYLRPTNCPPAPRNSTQFIIDDHGGSGSSRSNNASPAGASASASAAPSSSSFAEDGDSQWAERDFQSVYETAHREEVSAWDRKRLCEEISALERRQKELVKVLARIDPEVYLQRLEAQVASLRETGARLKAGLRRAKETAAAADTSNLSSPDPSAIEPPP